MAKDKIMYVCEECGQESPKWVGKCPACGQWNTMKEFRVATTTTKRAIAPLSMQAEVKRPIPMRKIEVEDEPRIDMGDGELNRVLGGGLMPGSLVLLGGEPGIGKSTLVLQTVLRMEDRKILYVSGEESVRQIKLRADRLCPDGGTDVLVLCETSLEEIY